MTPVMGVKAIVKRSCSHALKCVFLSPQHPNHPSTHERIQYCKLGAGRYGPRTPHRRKFFQWCTGVSSSLQKGVWCCSSSWTVSWECQFEPLNYFPEQWV